METKLFEIHEREDVVLALGVRLTPRDGVERAFLEAAGNPKVMLLTFDSNRCTSDYYDWPIFTQGRATLKRAHRYIQEAWDSLDSGAVVDVDRL